MAVEQRHPDVPEFHEPGLIARWAGHVARHPKRILLMAIAGFIIFAVIAVPLAGDFSNSFNLPGSESQKAYDLLEENFPARAGGSAVVAFETTDPAGVTGDVAQPQIQAVLDQIAALPHVVSIDSPYDNPAQISQSTNESIAFATVNYDVLPPDVPVEQVDQLIEITETAHSETLNVEAGGDVVGQTEGEFGNKSEIIGLIAAAIILLIAFGSVVAMGLPIVTALIGLVTGFLAIGILTRFMDIPEFVPAFVSMIGIGVGIDYALFIVTRYREGLRNGLNSRAAVARSLDTAGRAVLFAGTVVVISMLGLALVGIPFVTAAGVAAAVMVFMAVLVAMTILPALLAMIGVKIDKFSIPSFGSDGEVGDSFGAKLARRIQEKPWLYAIATTAILLLLALPALDVELGFPGTGSNPPSYHTRQTHDLLEKGFGPGFDAPLIITVEDPNGIQQADLDSLSSALTGAASVAAVLPPVINDGGDTAVITVFPTADANDEATKDLVTNLRSDVIPATLGDTSANAYVGGSTGSFIDFSDRMISRTPWVFVVVIGLSFLLLTMVFRSPVIALKAAIMNLLSISAAFGVLVAVFQWGWGASLIGLDETVELAVFLPIFLFAILFGLSMDYEVFLLSRIREFWVHGQETSDAVAHGLAVTARVITAAAAIMVAVFVSFALGPDPITKQFGIGLATAILIDATLVRLVLVPATMEILGEWNWWFPSWLSWMPHVNIEGTTLAPPQEFEPAPSAASAD